MNEMHRLPTVASNVDNVSLALDFLTQLVAAAFKGREASEDDWPKLGFFDDGSPLGDLIAEHSLNFDEYTVLALALAAHVRPELLDQQIRSAIEKAGDFPEIGGYRHAESRTFMPTGQTAAFLLSGYDLEARFTLQQVFGADHWLARKGILHLEPPKDGAPILSGQIIMSRDWIDRLTLGEAKAPPFSASFPARRLETQLSWDDLVLPADTHARLDEMLQWVHHFKTLSDDWGLGARLRPGYRALFHGASGTGKTFAATLLGKSTGREVFRVDLSAVVSKYIGETEKNLANLFTIAQDRNWILFFDEADALFGKRTDVKDSHDRYANQEVSYLLQRIEECEAMCILASNLRSNIDDAFLRRFNAVIRFPEPGPEERAEIWRRALPVALANDDLVKQISAYEMTGGAIVNVAQFAAISALSDKRKTITLEDMELGVQREVEKEGKVFRSLYTSKP